MLRQVRNAVTVHLAVPAAKASRNPADGRGFLFPVTFQVRHHPGFQSPIQVRQSRPHDRLVEDEQGRHQAQHEAQHQADENARLFHVHEEVSEGLLGFHHGYCTIMVT